MRMLDPTKLPLLNLCLVCSNVFTELDDASTSGDIHRRIWHEGNEYTYTRIRREVEEAAVLGCLFCDIIYADRRYKEKPMGKSVSQIGNIFRSKSPRPHWFPERDEELCFRIKYHSGRSELAVTLESKGPARTILEGAQLSYHWDLYSMKGNPAAQVIRQEAVIMDPGAPTFFEEVREWMNNCFNSHDECGQNGLVKLPARLIQISPPGSPEWAKLYDSHGVEGQYCALSYCWGGDQEHKTLSSRFEQYRKELPCERLPKTITDAFQVARNMNMEYIWIDSLCIIQDDEEDKQREIAKMMDIYRDAQFTISAASASKVGRGFLLDPLESRTGLYYHPLHINKDQIGMAIITPQASHRIEPLNKRGWTLQESLLTPRLLVFTDLMAVLKCQRGFQPNGLVPICRNIFQSRDSQASDAWESWYESLGYVQLPLESFRNCPVLPAPRVLQNDLLHNWHSVVEQYTRRHLTENRDRLPALSAIARAFAPLVDCPYYAGLWDKTMVYDLTWSVDETSCGPRFQSAGPSWSWATCGGKPCVYRFSEDIIRAKIVSCKTTPVSQSNPYGEVLAGELVLRGYLQQAWVIPGTAFSQLFDKDGNKYPASCFMSDDISSPPLDPLQACKDDHIEAWCLVLMENPGGAWRTGKNKPESNACTMMVLKKVTEEENVYRRIGIADAEAEQPPYWWEDNGQSTIVVI